MPCITEQHLVHAVRPCHIAAAAAVAVESCRERVASHSFERIERIATLWRDGAVAGLSETLRREREEALPDLGNPDPAEVAPEITGPLRQTLEVLLVCDEKHRGSTAERPAGRWSELAASVADRISWSDSLEERLGRRPASRQVDWGPVPVAPAIALPVLLSLGAAFAGSAAMGARLFIEDHRRLGGEDGEVADVFAAAAECLSVAAELVAGVAVALETAGSGPSADPGESMRWVLHATELYRVAYEEFMPHVDDASVAITGMREQADWLNEALQALESSG